MALFDNPAPGGGEEPNDEPSLLSIHFIFDPTESYTHIAPTQAERNEKIENSLGIVPMWIEGFYITNILYKQSPPFSFRNFLDLPSVYAHGGGSLAEMEPDLFFFDSNALTLNYPGDPALIPLMKIEVMPFRETWYAFRHSIWLRVLDNWKIEIYRID